MDLWIAYQNLEPGLFGNERAYLSTGNRWNASINRIQDRAVEIGISQARFFKYSDISRYVIAKDLLFDLLIMIYNVNTKDAFVLRTAKPFKEQDMVKIRKYLTGFNRPNLELRFIGLQNGQSLIAQNIERMRKLARNAILAEVDLFGNETRHIVLDLKTGTPYNLLLLNRIYRPGELVSASKAEDFPKGQLDLTYV